MLEEQAPAHWNTASDRVVPRAAGGLIRPDVLRRVAAGGMIDMMIGRIAPFLRSLLRFRLRTLLLAVLVCGVGMGVYVNRVRRQQAAIAAVKRLGGWAYYDYEIKDDQYDPSAESWAPAWLRKILPDDYMHPIVQVNMVYSQHAGQRLDNQQLTDEVLFHLDGFPRLEMLLLNEAQATDAGLSQLERNTRLRKVYMWDADQVTDAGVAHLAACRNLEYVHLSGSQLGDESARVFSQLPRLKGLSLQGNKLTDKGLAHLGKMKQLETLWIGCLHDGQSQITDAGVAHLAGLAQLEELDLQHTQVTNDGLLSLKRLSQLRSLYLNSSRVTDASELQAALPKCKIDYSPPR